MAAAANGAEKLDVDYPPCEECRPAGIVGYSIYERMDWSPPSRICRICGRKTWRFQPQAEVPKPAAAPMPPGHRRSDEYDEFRVDARGLPPKNAVIVDYLERIRWLEREAKELNEPKADEYYMAAALLTEQVCQILKGSIRHTHAPHLRRCYVCFGPMDIRSGVGDSWVQPGPDAKLCYTCSRPQ
jgi:hypothetical protein